MRVSVHIHIWNEKNASRIPTVLKICQKIIRARAGRFKCQYWSRPSLKATPNATKPTFEPHTLFTMTHKPIIYFF